MEGLRVFCIAFGLTTLTATGAPPSAPAPATAPALVNIQSTYELARGGCGSKGGPGYRKSNGKCASWRG